MVKVVNRMTSGTPEGGSQIAMGKRKLLVPQTFLQELLKAYEGPHLSWFCDSFNPGEIVLSDEKYHLPELHLVLLQESIPTHL